jgi:hypothetical protein
MTDSVRCTTCGATHKYDCPNIGPVQFLQAIMSDTTVPLTTRMKAADKLLHLMDKGIYSDDLGEAVTYVIPEQRWAQ